jgi:hypothetical protein
MAKPKTSSSSSSASSARGAKRKHASLLDDDEDDAAAVLASSPSANTRGNKGGGGKGKAAAAAAAKKSTKRRGGGDDKENFPFDAAVDFSAGGVLGDDGDDSDNEEMARLQRQLNAARSKKKQKTKQRVQLMTDQMGKQIDDTVREMAKEMQLTVTHKLSDLRQELAECKKEYREHAEQTVNITKQFSAAMSKQDKKLKSILQHAYTLLSCEDTLVSAEEREQQLQGVAKKTKAIFDDLSSKLFDDR